MRSPAVVRNTALGCIDCLQAALRAYVGMERLGIVTPDTSRKHPRISSIRDRDRGVQRPFQKCIASVDVR